MRKLALRSMMPVALGVIFGGAMLLRGTVAMGQVMELPQVEQRRVEARLLADVTAVEPGRPFQVGVVLDIREGWHIYWQNPGEAGMATAVDFSVPEGFEVGELRFPVPVRFEDPGQIVGYGYEDKVMLLATVTPPAGLAMGEPVRIVADAAWLACERICIMEEAEMELELPVSQQAGPANRELFEQWTARLPRREDERLEQVIAEAAEERVQIRIVWNETVEDVEWFPLPPENVFLAPAQVKHSGRETRIELAAPRDDQVELPFVVAYRDAAGERRGVEQSIGIARE